MPHDTGLIATLVIGLGAAFVLGLLAARLRLPPIVGYLLAGIAVGPFTPGLSADQALAQQLAELGVILLMFGVGLHFSIKDLVEVRGTAVPGALAQIFVTGSVGASLALWWGWGRGGAVVLALALGVASTVVLLKGLEARDRLDSPEGRLAVGWLVVEDLTMVLALVLLPALAPMLGGTQTGPPVSTGALVGSVAVAIGKVIVFAGFMFVFGRRAVPWLLEHVARLGSRELFTLAVLTTALGVGALASSLFGVSFALGAFFAGAVIAESELSHRAAADALPLQDAFAVLFFVSVGMLFDPVVFARPVQVLALVLVIVVGKSLVTYGLLRFMKHPPRVALAIGAALGQIGEFSFIVAALGLSLGLVPREAQALIVAAALIAITVNGPVLSLAAGLAQRWTRSTDEATPHTPRPTTAMPVTALGTVPSTLDSFVIEDPYDFSDLDRHVILVGHGRVGTTVAEALKRAGEQHVIIEEQERIVGGLRRRGERAIFGDATRPEVLQRAGIENARLIVVTSPEPFRARRIIELSRESNPSIAIAVRTHSATEQAFLEELLSEPGSTGRAVYAEREAALSLAHYALLTLGETDDEADRVIASLRGEPTAPTETFKSLPTREYQALTRTGEGAGGTAGGQAQTPGGAPPSPRTPHETRR
jgi:monovalent cation:H+ antiporter-2, CPA2 family